MQMSQQVAPELMQSVMETQAGYLKSKPAIGSIRNGQITYSADHTFFGENDTRTRGAKDIARVVKTEIDKDVLGSKKAKWDTSVGVTGWHKEQDHRQNLFEVKVGLRDDTITEAKPQKVYAGCDTRNQHYTGWNVSSETVNPRDAERFLQAT